jgi:hypothetical protein
MSLEVAASAVAEISAKEGKTDLSRAIEIDYGHCRRTIIPVRLFWGTNEFHTEPQWLMEAWDVDLGATKVFALLGFDKAPAAPKK